VGLKGRTLGIAGYGKIGSVVAGYGRAFGMRVIALGDHETSLAAAAADGVETQADRSHFFSEADVVCCHLRLLPATRNSITLQDLSVMKDVYAHEPLYGSNHPLIGLDNVLATPHIGYVEKDTYEHYFGIAIQQLIAWCAGAPINVLNPQALTTGAAG
jgi:D-3-phosphoglycerate dehydrogenase